MIGSKLVLGPFLFRRCPEMIKRRKLNTVAALGLLLSVTMTQTTFAGDAGAGQAKAGVCGGCHGPDGVSFSPEIPNLKGQKEAYLIKAIGDYKSGARKNPMMSSMVGGLNETDIADIAAYYASLK